MDSNSNRNRDGASPLEPIVEKLRSIPVYSWLLGATPSFALVSGVAAMFDGTESIWWTGSQRWGQGIYRAAGVRKLVTQGLEAINNRKPYIVMSNHQSGLDVPCLLHAMPRPVSFLTKKELFKFPFFGFALKRVGHISVDRRDRESAFASIDDAARQIGDGRLVMIFPEGTRSRDGQLLPFKKGGFVLAIKSGVPIVPLGIAGTAKVLPPGFWVKGKGNAAMVMGEPIETAGWDLDNKEGLMQIVRERIDALKDDAKALLAQSR